MKIFGEKEIWFVTGSQHLYGPGPLKMVAADSAKIVAALAESDILSISIRDKGMATTPAEVLRICQEANTNANCVGLVLWMHTFSPAKMWIAGLKALSKPYMHLHTQFNEALPWSSIDMDFMNLNQSAHGCREFGYIATRLRNERKVVVGHWSDRRVQSEMDDWARAAMGYHESHSLKVARFGDNMRQVAVTDGDKVGAQIQFGFEVNGYGVGDLAAVVNEVKDSDVSAQIDVYRDEYIVSEALLKDAHQLAMLKNDARLELALRSFLDEGGFGAFTNTFEDLHGLTGLPGLATQRLMSQGFGYGGEGDWKTAALVRIMKVMARGKTKGTTFMEDYTYHFGAKSQVLGAHMLEICPSIAAAKPRVVVARHTIGCTADIARLIFTGSPGPAINVACIDLGNRFRLLLNEVDGVTPEQKLPNLPVAHTLWEPRPDLAVGAAAWIHGGGAHHTVYSQAVSTDTMVDFAEMVGVELAIIDADTRVRNFKNELRQSAVYYHISQGV